MRSGGGTRVWMALVAGLLTHTGDVDPRPRAEHRLVGGEPVRGSTALDDESWTPLPSSGRPRPANGIRRWLVVCWDGASWDLALPLLRAGRMPNLARLAASGASGNLYSIQPGSSPVVWTTVATGVKPLRHGILGFVRAGDGGQKLYSNRDRRAKAVWNLLSETGRRVAVIGYHNTFPAEPVNGVMVSNYAARIHQGARWHAGGPAGDAIGLAGAVYPPGLGTEVGRPDLAPSRPDMAELRRFAAVEEDEQHLAAGAAWERDLSRWGYLAKAYAYDRFHARLAQRWLSLRPDLTLVHFQSPDWAGHQFLVYHWPERFLLPGGLPRAFEDDRRVFGGTVGAFYEYVDEWLGVLAAAAAEDTAVMVLSDHGMEPDPSLTMGNHARPPPGMLVMAGAGVRGGRRLDGATVFDILPTLMATLGLPVADDLDGRVLVEAFEPSLWLERPPKRVASYGRHRQAGADNSLDRSVERQLQEELRALGYIR